MIASVISRCRAASRGFQLVSGAVLLIMIVVLAGWKRPVHEEMLIAKKTEEKRWVRAYLLIPVWLRKGWIAGTAVAGVVFLGSPWLARRWQESMSFRATPPMPALKRWEPVACAGLMVLAAWQSYPRLCHSLWGDEEYEAAVFILGEPLRKEDGSLTPDQIPWSQTLWDMRKPTNHVGYSVLARLVHDSVFKRSNGPRDPWFDEALIRLPTLVFGLLVIPAMFWALRVWGLRPWWALGFLLLHPWFMRFISEARGYAFVFLGATVLMGLLGRALQTGRWRWWLAFGFAEFLTLWCCLQSLYPVTGINLLALACLMDRGLQSDARWLQMGRWITANLLGATLVLVMMAPCLPQLQHFMKTGEMMGDLPLKWWRDSFSMLLCGQLWDKWAEPGHPYQTAMQVLLEKHPLLLVVTAVFVLGIVIAGILAFLKNKAWRPLLIFAVGSIAIMISHNAASGRSPYDWYLCAFLPGLIFVIAAGTMNLERLPRLMSNAALILALASFAWLTHRPRAFFREHPSEAGRESVAMAREVTNPFHPDFGKGIILVGHPIAMPCYDPDLIRIDTVSELTEQMNEADASGSKLFVNVNRIADWREDRAEYCALLEKSGKFEHVGSFPGLMSYASRDVFRYRGKQK
jgi:hypothetical protein